MGCSGPNAIFKTFPRLNNSALLCKSNRPWRFLTPYIFKCTNQCIIIFKLSNMMLLKLLGHILLLNRNLARGNVSGHCLGTLLNPSGSTQPVELRAY